MFQHAAKLANCSQRRRELSLVVAGAIMFTTPANVIDFSEPTPKLARRMCDYWMRPQIETCVSIFVPRVNARQAEVTTAFRDKKRGDVR